MIKSLQSLCISLAILSMQASAIAGDSSPLAASQFPYTALTTAAGCATPEWPREALRYEIEGVTTLNFEIDQDGNVVNPTIRKSSAWNILDDAALRGLAKCKFKANLEEAKGARTFPIQYVWKLNGDGIVLHPLLVPNSCRPSERFQTFKNFDRNPSNGSGILVRFLVVGEGQAGRIAAEPNGQPAELVDDAIEFVKSCRFAIAPDVQGSRTDTLFGRVILK